MQATVQPASGSFENGPRLSWESTGRAKIFRYALVAIYIGLTISGVSEIATFLHQPMIFHNAGCWLLDSAYLTSCPTPTDHMHVILL